jgi:hypothetical protein
LLTKEMLLAWLPVVLGVKVTENLTDCPELSVMGTVRPLTLNPLAGPLSCVISRLALPELLSVAVCVLVTPMVTFPKLMLLGVIAMDGCAFDCTPVPVSEIVVELCFMLLESDRLPWWEPDEEGRNDTRRVTD